MTKGVTDPPADDEASLRRVAEVWADTASAKASAPVPRLGWLDSEIVLRHYVRPRQHGMPTVDWLPGLVETLRIPRDGRWLSLGCGGAGTEINAARSGCFANMDAFDISEGALAEARSAAAAQGIESIRFAPMNINDVSLPREAYDVAVMCMSLHHVSNLGGTLDAILEALKPGGWFLLNEYIGPRQCQFSDAQLEAVRALLAALPSFWRLDATTGREKTEYPRRTVEQWNAADPSEAIRSDLIVPEVARRFEVVLRTDYGGTILNPMLEHIVHNFALDDPKDVAAIRLIAAAEDLLIRSGVLSSDFTVLATRRPRDPGTWAAQVRSIRRWARSARLAGDRVLRSVVRGLLRWMRTWYAAHRGAKPGNLRREEVIWAYRILLGRDPESDEPIAAWRSSGKSLAELRDEITSSAEFRLAERKPSPESH